MSAHTWYRLSRTRRGDPGRGFTRSPLDRRHDEHADTRAGAIYRRCIIHDELWSVTPGQLETCQSSRAMTICIREKRWLTIKMLVVMPEVATVEKKLRCNKPIVRICKLDHFPVFKALLAGSNSPGIRYRSWTMHSCTRDSNFVNEPLDYHSITPHHTAICNRTP